MEEKKLKKCFISATLTTNLSSLYKLLKNKGIEVMDAASLPFSKMGYSKIIKNEIRKSDFVFVILDSKTNPNLYFEIGLAVGLKKPIFMIVDNRVDIPFDLREIVYVKTTLDDIEKIEFALDQFLYQVPKKRRYPHKEKKKLEIFLDASVFINQIESLSGFNGLEIERYIANLFEKNENIISVKQQPQYVDKGVDMALWIDSTESILGNPILVEIKSGILSKSRLLHAEEQLRKYIENTNSSVGLLIYFDKNGKTFHQNKIRKPLVIWLELRGLISELSKNTLEQVVVNQRNRIFHSSEER